MTTPNPFAMVTTSSVDLLSGLADRALQGIERVAALNVQTIKTLLAESEAHVEAVLSARSLDSLRELQASFLRTVPEKAATYSNHVQKIFSALTIASVSSVSPTVSATHPGEAVVDASRQVPTAMVANMAEIGDAPEGSNHEAIAA